MKERPILFSAPDPDDDPMAPVCLPVRSRAWGWCLAHNLAVAGFGALMWRSGDNHGFHMGSDESQCTCQWAPGRGEQYRPSSRCEQEEYYDEPEVELDDFDDAGEWPDNLPIDGTAGPNGCTCGFNGDRNCRFIP